MPTSCTTTQQEYCSYTTGHLSVAQLDVIFHSKHKTNDFETPAAQEDDQRPAQWAEKWNLVQSVVVLGVLSLSFLEKMGFFYIKHERKEVGWTWFFVYFELEFCRLSTQAVKIKIYKLFSLKIKCLCTSWQRLKGPFHVLSLTYHFVCQFYSRLMVLV